MCGYVLFFLPGGGVTVKTTVEVTVFVTVEVTVAVTVTVSVDANTDTVVRVPAGERISDTVNFLF